jgi:hypothetical protein
VLLLAVCVGVAALWVAGCAQSASIDGVAQIAGANTLPVPPVTTELINPGVMPRARCDTTATLGAAQHVTLTVRKNMRQQVDGQPDEHFATPDVTIPLTATAAVGEIGLVIGTATSSDPALTADLAAAAGSRAALLTDDRGSVTAFRLDTTDPAEPEARAALQRGLAMAIEQQIVFPDAAIGPGAVWQIHRHVPGRVPLEQITTATLLSHADGVLRIQVRLEQRVATDLIVAADHNTTDAPRPADQPIVGIGTVTVDRGLPLPVQGDIAIDGDRVYRDSAATVQLRQTTAIRVRWSS